MQVLHNTWKHMRRSPYQSMAAILTMFLTMLLTGLFFLATAGSSLVLHYFESKPQITVFFTNKAAAGDAAALKKTLEATGKVASVKFVSKEDALAIYREQNKSDPLLLEMVTADILPASLEVSAVDPNLLHELEPVIKQGQGVEEVVFQKDVVDTLLRWTNAIRLVGSLLVGLLALDSILIVMTVIGMKIAIKKEEIEILTLVGASPWYVRLPFVLEGGLYGTIGAFFSWIIISVLVVWLRPIMLGFLGIIPVIASLLANPLSGIFLLSLIAFLGFLSAIGFILGSLGSFVALGRYLKF
jgi:cell division transport system permease protein